MKTRTMAAIPALLLLGATAGHAQQSADRATVPSQQELAALQLAPEAPGRTNGTLYLLQLAPGGLQPRQGVPVLSKIPILGSLFLNRIGNLPVAPTPLYKTAHVLAPESQLRRLVSVQVKNADIADIAEALAVASGRRITVAPALKRDRRLTITAVNYPLAGILESVAAKLDLCIMPQEGGAILTEWPTTGSTELRIPSRAATAPWAAEWKRPPYTASPDPNINVHMLWLEYATEVDLPELYEIGAPNPQARRATDPNALPDPRFAALKHSLNIRLETASLGEALAALSKAAGCPLRAAPSLQNSTQVRLSTSNTLVGTALASLAKATQTMLVPEKGGITLYPYPSLDVDGHKVYLADGEIPWSPRWKDVVGYQTVAGGKPMNTVYGLPENQAYPPWSASPTEDNANRRRVQLDLPPIKLFESVLTLKDQPITITPQKERPLIFQNRIMLQNAPSSWHTRVETLFGNRSAATANQGLILTAMGNDMFVAAEHGVDAEGRPGYYLTIYKLVGAEIKKVASTFHRSQKRL